MIDIIDIDLKKQWFLKENITLDMVILQCVLVNFLEVIRFHSICQWIGLLGKIYFGKPHDLHGKRTLVSGEDFP